MSGRAFWLTHAVLPAALVAAAYAALLACDADTRVSDAFFDPARGAFPLRNDFWIDKGLHDGGRWLVIGVGIAALAAWLRRRDRGALYVFLCLAAGPALVALLKHWSSVECPWDLPRYGAAEPGPGHCFPSGHSSGAFSMFTFYFLLRGRDARAAVAALAGTLCLGAAFALTQWARGAHVPTHDLASAWICWCTCLALYPVCAPAPRPDAAPVALA